MIDMNSKIALQEDHKRDYFLLSKNDILKSINLYIDFIDNESELSDVLKKNTRELFKKFYKKVSNSILPDITNKYRYYEYRFLTNKIVLCLFRYERMDVVDDCITIDSVLEHELLNVDSDYISIKEFAYIHNLKTEVVLQWIKKGKLKHAKMNNNDWSIPKTETLPSGDFEDVNYTLIDGMKVESDEFAFLSLCNEIYMYPEDNSKKITCRLRNANTEYREKFTLPKSQAERLEYIIIASGKFEIDYNIQYSPSIS